jgi:hypothetical protein
LLVGGPVDSIAREPDGIANGVVRWVDMFGVIGKAGAAVGMEYGGVGVLKIVPVLVEHIMERGGVCAVEDGELER